MRKNKLISFLISLTMSTLILLSGSVAKYNSSEAASNYRLYKVFNATTGAYIAQYSISQSQVLETMTRGAFDPNINTVNEYNLKKGVVKIMCSDNYLGTGFIVDDYTIATAAHCLIDSNSTSSKIISDVLLFDNNDNITLHASPEQIHLPTEWYNFANSNHVFSNDPEVELEHWTYDYALITVEENLSDYMHYKLGTTLNYFYPYSSNVNPNKLLKIIGYPSSSNNHVYNQTEIESGYALYYTNSSYYNPYNALLYYSNSTSSGYSGSPVYYTEQYNNTDYNTVIGIHTAGSCFAPNARSGVRFTDDHLTFYLNNPYLNS